MRENPNNHDNQERIPHDYAGTINTEAISPWEETYPPQQLGAA